MAALPTCLGSLPACSNIVAYLRPPCKPAVKRASETQGSSRLAAHICILLPAIITTTNPGYSFQPTKLLWAAQGSTDSTLERPAEVRLRAIVEAFHMLSILGFPLSPLTRTNTTLQPSQLNISNLRNTSPLALEPHLCCPL